jgi:hypothetical protein
VQRIAVNSVHSANGESEEAILLNHILIDLKQFVPATNENEIVLPATTPTAKAKASPV